MTNKEDFYIDNSKSGCCEVPITLSGLCSQCLEGADDTEPNGQPFYPEDAYKAYKNQELR